MSVDEGPNEVRPAAPMDPMAPVRTTSIMTFVGKFEGHSEPKSVIAHAWVMAGVPATAFGLADLLAEAQGRYLPTVAELMGSLMFVAFLFPGAIGVSVAWYACRSVPKVPPWVFAGLSALIAGAVHVVLAYVALFAIIGWGLWQAYRMLFGYGGM